MELDVLRELQERGPLLPGNVPRRNGTRCLAAA
jgi:hypothetical protein